MLVGGDLVFFFRAAAAVFVVLLGPVVGVVVRRKWRRVVARRDEINRLLVLASEEAAKAELEAAAEYTSGFSYGYSYGSVLEEELPASAPTTVPVLASASSPVQVTRQLPYQCALCFSPASAKCSRCKAVRYCSGKCQIIHWRQGHKDKCHLVLNCNHQSSDETCHSKAFKQNANESFANGIEDEGAQSPLPINVSAEPVLSKSSMSGISNGMDAMEGNHLTDETTSNSDSDFSVCSISTTTSSKSSTSVSDSDDSVQTQTCQPNMEQCKLPSLEQPTLIRSINAVSTSSRSSHIKPGSEDIKSSSSGSRISSIGSGESSSLGHNSSSCGFWEGAANYGLSKMYVAKDVPHPSPKESVDINMSGSRSSPYHSSEITKAAFPDVDEQSCQAQISKVRKQNDSAGLLQIKDTMEFRRSSPLKPETPTKTEINYPNEKCTLNSMETSHPLFTASHACPMLHLASNSTLKVNGLLRESNGGIEGINNISHTPKALQVESLPATAYFGHPSSSIESHEFRSMKSIKNDSTQQVTAHSSECGNDSQNCKIGLEVIDQLKNLKLPPCNSLGAWSEIAGRYNGKGIFPYELFVKLYDWSKVELHPFGLSNCGNSCYANAVLQCLAFTPPLTAYFLQGLHSKGCRKEGWCFTCELESLVLKAKEGNSPLSPIRIVSHLENIGSNLGNGQEEDAHEFLRYVIDTMQSVCLKEVGVTVSGSLEEETTLIGLTFGGCLRSKIECMRCGGKSEKHERMMDLIVEIYGDVVTLEEALKQFSRTEVLDGENKYHCSRCKSYEKARKKMKVLEAPNVLTITLKRYQSGKFGKLNKPVTFPEILNLAPYMSGTSDKSPIYQLYGVIVHLDVMNAAFSGHYICYVKNFQNKWFRVDDSTVKAVKLESVLSERAYILLYARCSPRATRSIKKLSIPHDARRLKHLNRKPRSEMSSWDIFEGDDYLSDDNSSSLFSEVGTSSSSTDSSHRDSVSIDDYFEISGDPGGFWRNSSDSDASSSSSPSPLYSRHSQHADMETTGYSSQNAEPTANGQGGFWAGITRSRDLGSSENKGKCSFLPS
ncbi:PREDICTED: ubiquitin carboxyl-terminal hydrolase 16-like isoform X2 [Ipomoea nil]|uniref:ubiquitin carboxyl-terminal hydrolase 16-like isoform X2 n=1 Tax=Ipomoea nil TaxID=35883 RepID=UPI000901A139|nr:PREDICTED: ubiquitin carboxyl-terminal hydrolase 16-like isoform X2 [Ipomoea nil]